MENEAESAFLWSGRPFRHLTTQEVRASLEDRQAAKLEAPNAMAAQFIQVAIDRLEAELFGREIRATPEPFRG